LILLKTKSRGTDLIDVRQ
jgi:hypothetical protein